MPGGARERRHRNLYFPCQFANACGKSLAAGRRLTGSRSFMPKAVRKAVFPVAGLGTRFLPATKAMPKEMLPVVDKPLIQYAIEEAKAAGIEECYFVTGGAKKAIGAR